MTPKKLITLLLISISGIGLFTLFFNLFNQQLAQVASNQTTNNNLESNSNSSNLNPASNSTGLISDANTNIDENKTAISTTQPLIRNSEEEDEDEDENENLKTNGLKTVSNSPNVNKPATSTNSNTTPPAAKATTPAQNNTTPVSTPTTTPITTAATTFKDGTYSATGSYRVPKSTETIKVSIQLSSDKISSVSVQNSATRGDSAAYQQDFASAISGQVVGKKLDAVDLSIVNGASLTTEGFMTALNQIKSQASV